MRTMVPRFAKNERLTSTYLGSQGVVALLYLDQSSRDGLVGGQGVHAEIGETNPGGEHRLQGADVLRAECARQLRV